MRRSDALSTLNNAALRCAAIEHIEVLSKPQCDVALDAPQQSLLPKLAGHRAHEADLRWMALRRAGATLRGSLSRWIP
jgi:hypothetical protein